MIQDVSRFNEFLAKISIHRISSCLKQNQIQYNYKNTQKILLIKQITCKDLIFCKSLIFRVFSENFPDYKLSSIDCTCFSPTKVFQYKKVNIFRQQSIDKLNFWVSVQVVATYFQDNYNKQKTQLNLINLNFLYKFSLYRTSNLQIHSDKCIHTTQSAELQFFSSQQTWSVPANVVATQMTTPVNIQTNVILYIQITIYRQKYVLCCHDIFLSIISPMSWQPSKFIFILDFFRTQQPRVRFLKYTLVLSIRLIRWAQIMYFQLLQTNDLYPSFDHLIFSFIDRPLAHPLGSVLNHKHFKSQFSGIQRRKTNAVIQRQSNYNNRLDIVAFQNLIQFSF
eukprot:TRINITY_DN34880_c0_g2_i11.p1 TRINITY_DN34880_c0_g2~~TRINITY_DN34880_c0_g2_i11.p1  ORF type:complete len:337 (-),score=-24.34 TRINITY_DN34880_c0_g2_i11:172-1182(-)